MRLIRVQLIPKCQPRAVSPAAGHASRWRMPRPARAAACIELADGTIVANTVGENRGGGGPDGDYLPCERCAESALEGAGFGG
jgi:hypothetical protein